MEKFSLEPEDLSNTFIHLTNFAQVVVLLVMIVNSQKTSNDPQTKRGESKTCYPEGCQVREDP